MIEGVIIKNLRKISDERGTIMKMQESCDSEFKGFGEMYFSTIYPRVVKGWHLHENAVLNYAVIRGMIKLVLFDNRVDSISRGEIMEIFIGDDNYSMVQIPKGVWNAFQCVGNITAIVADLISISHNEDLMVRMDPHNNDIIKYDWSIKDR